LHVSSVHELYPVHELYYEQCGNEAGKSVVFPHGGPGAGLVPAYRRFFDPAAYRMILLDQRGARKSTPHPSLEDNTTWHLVADSEQIREQLAREPGNVELRELR
jgi:proline iminopeptidase